MNNVVRRQGASAIPVNSEGKILLQLRDDRPDLLYPNCWTTLGGGVEEGETFDEAIRRELMEEIELELPVKLWRIDESIIEIHGHQFLVQNAIYAARIDLPVSEIKLNEGQRLGYFGLEDLPNLQIGYNFEPMFRDFFAALKNGILPL